MKFLALILLSLSLPALASLTPEETADAFLSARIDKGSLGAPGGMELAEYSPYFSPEMVCLLAAARRYNDKHEQLRPGDAASSPFASGDLYSGSAGIPVSYTLGKAAIKGSKATLGVSFDAYTTAGDSIVREARMFMGQHKHRWVIEDIEFSEPPETPPQTLRLLAGLREVLEQTTPSIDWDSRELAGCPKGNELARLQAEKHRKTARKSKSSKRSAPAKTATSKKATTKPASRASSSAHKTKSKTQ